MLNIKDVVFLLKIQCSIIRRVIYRGAYNVPGIALETVFSTKKRNTSDLMEFAFL